MLHNLRNRFWGKWFVTMPKNDPMILSRCKHYIDDCNGDSGNNNANPDTNGEVRIMRQLLPQCQVVFDVGANVGKWTQKALTVNPVATVYCFEPSHATFEALSLCGFGSNVHLNQTGLGAEVTTRTFFKFSDTSSMNSLYERRGLEDSWDVNPQALTETIELTTLDAYCADHQIPQIDFLKIDVEGHELAVLQGATQMLAGKHIRYLQFEYGGTFIDANILLKHIFELLLPLGYHLYKIMPDTLRPVEHYGYSLENFQYQNWLASADRL